MTGEREQRTRWEMQIVPVGAPVQEFEFQVGGGISPVLAVSISTDEDVLVFHVVASGHPDWTGAREVFATLEQIVELGREAYPETEENHG